MIRKVALLASCLTLASCATPSHPPGPAKPPAPVACDAQLEAAAPVAPEPPAGATIVQPATMAERVATSLYVGWVAELLAIIGQLDERVELARAACAARH